MTDITPHRVGATPATPAPTPAQIENVAAAEPVRMEDMPAGLREFGDTGLKRAGGFIGEEFLTELSGRSGIKVFKEMSENDPVAGGMMFAIARILGRLPWEIQDDPDAGPADVAAGDFIRECFDDMSTPWSNVLEDILSMGPYGWALLEMNLKLRRGPDDLSGPEGSETMHQSKYSDGKIGWRGFKIRAQDSLVQWEYDDHGGLVGMTQQVDQGGGLRKIPMAKSLLFRTSTFKDNPEGRSLLRGAYRPWYFKKRIEEIEGIGIERDLSGLPVATLPPEYFYENASAEHKATLRTMQNLVTQIRNDESGGIVMPVAFDSHGNKLVSLELLAAPGAKGIDVGGTITRKSQEMTMSILMDFLLLGHEGVGSFALGASRIDLWTMAIQQIAKIIAETFDQGAIARLLKFNRIHVDKPPRLVFGDIQNVDLPTIGAFIEQMVNSGALVPGPELDEFVRKVGNLPPATAQTFRDDPGQ